MRGGSGRGSLRSGSGARSERPGPTGVVVKGEDEGALGEVALGEDASADAWSADAWSADAWEEGAADPPLLVAAPTCPGDVISGPPLPVPGVSEPPSEGNAELITGAAVRRARTPFGRPDQR
jgi:hypothetical protein